MPQEHNALPATLGSGKDNSVGATREWGLPGRTQVRCYFLILAGVAEQYDFELDSLQTAWLPTLVSVLCPQPARGLGPGSRPDGRWGQLAGPWLGPPAARCPVATLVPTESPQSRHRGSALFREVIAGSAGVVPCAQRPSRGKALDAADVGSPPRPCGARGPIIGPLYPVRLLFIPGPEVWGFKPHKAWTRCPGP